MFKIEAVKNSRKININLRLYYGCPKAEAISFMRQSYPEYKIKKIERKE